MKCHQHIYILARSPALLLWILFHHMEKCWQVAHTVADHSLDTCLQLASALHCTLVPWNYRNFKEKVETMHVASRQRMVSEFMTIYTKKPWPTMPELPTVLFCCAMMEKGSAVLEVVFRSNVQATTWRSNGWSNGWSRRSDLLGLHAAPLAAAVAEANASVFLREARAVKASTLAQHGTAKPFVACHWNACNCFCLSGNIQKNIQLQTQPSFWSSTNPQYMKLAKYIKGRKVN